MGRENSPARALNLFHIFKLVILAFTYFVKFHIVSLVQCSSKHIRIKSVGLISCVRHLLRLCCRHRRPEHLFFRGRSLVAVEEIKKLRNIVATGSAGISEMILYRLPITHSLVPIDNQVTYIFL